MAANAGPHGDRHARRARQPAEPEPVAGHLGAGDHTNSSDPSLERRIFGKVASAGRQIGRIADVLDILIAAFERDTLPEPTAAAAIAAYRGMREEIAREKAARAPERYIDALETLRSEDPKVYAQLLPRLRQWLNEQAGGGAAPTEPPVPG
jgi:hypothetical protein